MKIISALSLLMIPALAFAAEEARDLQIADWHVTITTVNAQSLAFETGAGGGTTPNIKIKVSDMCRLQGATRADVGSLFPTSNVVGIDANGAGIVNNPGTGNSISWKFVEGINGNAAIFTDDLDTTATVEFCIEVGLYEDVTLINYAEVLLTYDINLVTNFPTLSGYTVSQADAFNDAADTSLTFDGTLLAYFCNGGTKAELTNDGSKTTQGSIIDLCFKVPDGQFEVADVTDLTVKDLNAATPTQAILVGGVIQSATTPYATKSCTDVDASDTNVCVVSFLLKADFYDFAALTLGGSGSVLLEFGDASGSRRMLRRQLKAEPVSEEFAIKPLEIQFEKAGGSSASTAMTSLAAFGAIAGAALAL